MKRTGTAGALLDIYEQVIGDFKSMLRSMPDEALTVIRDGETMDENCRSVQTVLTHVVHAGFGYASFIYGLKGHDVVRPAKKFHLTIAEYLDDLDRMFVYTENIFREVKQIELEGDANPPTVKTDWGEVFDIEQLTEHAIVHILRHQRQVRKFMFMESNTDLKSVIDLMYKQFNERNIDAIVELMHEDVHWPNGWEGGYVNGHSGVREYWTRQWKEINPVVTPVDIVENANGDIEVTVHQLVKDYSGGVLFDGLVKHIYKFKDGLIAGMEIEKM